ncbi:MAG: response regulator transcription factor [bacterium]
MTTTDILLVDDHTATREELLFLLSVEKDLNVVGEASSGEEAVREAERLRPDLVIMDILMPGMNGIEATRRIHSANPEVRILTLSNHTGRGLLKATLDAGAVGYVAKDHAYEELVDAIRAVADGGRYVGADMDR